MISYNFDVLKFLSNVFAQIDNGTKQINPKIEHLLFVLNVIALVITVLVVILIVLFIKRAKEKKEQKTIKTEPIQTKEEIRKEHYQQHWNEILEHLDSILENDWKFAIIEADKLIDNILRDKNYQGETISERLSLVTKQEIPSIDQLWQAHKIRNKIVHEPTFRLTKQEAQKTIEAYKQALKELGAIAT